MSILLNKIEIVLEKQVAEHTWPTLNAQLKEEMQIELPIETKPVVAATTSTTAPIVVNKIPQPISK